MANCSMFTDPWYFSPIRFLPFYPIYFTHLCAQSYTVYTFTNSTIQCITIYIFHINKSDYFSTHIFLQYSLYTASFHTAFHISVFIFIFIFYLIEVSMSFGYLLICFLSHLHNSHHCFLSCGLEISNLLHTQQYLRLLLHLSHY